MRLFIERIVIFFAATKELGDRGQSQQIIKIKTLIFDRMQNFSIDQDKFYINIH